MDNNIYSQNVLEFNDGSVSTWKATMLSTDSSSAKYYPLGSRKGPKRGRCVILNYEHFLDQSKNRRGTEFDVSALKKTFELLNFEILLHHDLTKRGTELVLDNESQFDHSKYHCFVICVLSHGEANKFLCIDDEGIEYDHVFAKFNGKQCPSLAGKPKLFFFQACQGANHDSGVILNVDSTQSQGHQGNNSFKLESKPDNPQSQPVTADQFAFYCSYKNYYSMRNPEKGTWFISELTSTFDTYSHEEDLISMTTIVQQKVAEKEAAVVTMSGQAGIKQMPSFFSTLLKKLVFS